MRHHFMQGGGPGGPGDWEDRLRGAAARMGGPGPWPPGPFGPGPHGPGHGHGPWGGGRGRRGARRGDVRAAILGLLAERPMHGYEMIQELSNRTGGFWKPSPGSVYPTLQLLEDEGLITGEESDGRRRFTLTEAGQAESEKAGRGRVPWEHMTEDVGETMLELRGAYGQLFQAFQAMHSGTEAQQAKAVELLTETRRKLYAILAEDEQAT
jgi:DNA-binding PadR family transcriptional regulator